MSLDLANFNDVRRLKWGGHPTWRIHAGRIARVACLLLLLLLATFIALYVRMTEPKRVRAIAVQFLSGVIDGDISIREARLSFFEGLQLDDVTISTRADRSLPGVAREVLRAKRLQISYSPTMLVTGRIDSARVLAIEPTVHLVEDVDGDRWNVQLLQRRPDRPATTRPTTGPSTPTRLPEVILRGGRVERGQVIAGKYERLETVRLEGQLLPRADAGGYRFNLQTRTETGLAGPALQGQASLTDGSVRSSLVNVRLDFLEPLMPARVRTFWQKLAPGGRVDVPTINASRRADGRYGFKIEIELAGVKMRVRPTDWVGPVERRILTDPGSVAESLRTLPGASPMIAAVLVQPQLRTGTIPLEDVNGRLSFNEDGVALERLSASVDGNRFDIRGHLDGYGAGAPLALNVESPTGRPIRLPASVPYMNSLPAEVREVYYRFRPEGRSALAVSIRRDATNGPVKASGAIEFAGTQFTFEAFPFPVHNASGRLVVDEDPTLREPRLVIDRIRGNGPPNGPNARGELSVDGEITPLLGFARVDVTVRGRDLRGEPSLVAALPTPARDLIHEFDDDGDGPGPDFAGDFVCRVHREPGPVSKWSYDTDVNLRDARGAFAAFPYPLEALAADLEIRKDHVTIKNGRARHGTAAIAIDGITEWGPRVNPNRRVGEPGVRTTLSLSAKNVPVDDALRKAVPGEAREVLNAFGIGGTFDIDGPIVVDDPKRPPKFELAIAARDGRFAPLDWKTSVSKIEAALKLTPTRLEVVRVAGRRDESPVVASGFVDWSTPVPQLSIDVDAQRVRLDQSLYDSLPGPAAKSVWASLRPSGETDAGLALRGPAGSPTWSLGLAARGAANVTPDFLALPMTHLSGAIRATEDRVDLAGVGANVADGTATLEGRGEFAAGGRSAWTLKLRTVGTVIDPALRDALPRAMGSLLTDNAVLGKVDLNFDRLDWTTSPPPTSATDASFDGRATLTDASWSTGVAVDRASGTARLKGRFVDDAPAELSGGLDLPTFRIAGLDARDGAATVTTEAAGRRFKLTDVRARLGEGEVAGDLLIDRRARDLTRWSANFLLRNADVSKLAAGAAAKPAEGGAAAVGELRGELNASLSIEGGWGEDGKATAAVPRRGRGDISISGERMLNVPMVLGVTQIVSLSLPFTGGFREATASYSLDGDRVTFDGIQLESAEMKIKGDGWLDLGERKVSLDFYTASAGKGLPVIGKLLDAARKELFQLKVRGSLSEPQLKAGTMQTITTTVDEMLGAERK